MPSLNFLINGGISHPNSETLIQMGVEYLTFLVYMTEQESTQFSMLGFHTKDQGSIIYLISNLFKIMGSREQNFMSPQALKICQKLIYRMLKFHKKEDIVFVLRELFKNDKTIINDDVTLSVLINNYVKPLMQGYSDPSDEQDPFLNLVVD